MKTTHDLTAGASEARRLRLWPGALIVAAQLAAFHVPGLVAPSSPSMFYGMLLSFGVGTPLVCIWWLFFSRALWRDRLGGLALLIVAHTAAVVLADPSARNAAVLAGTPWLCAAFVASLFAGRRAVTILTVFVASFGWTLVRTDGVTGSMSTEFAWRWSDSAERRFLASDASRAPEAPSSAATETGPADSAAAGAAGFAAVAVWPGFRGPGRDGVVVGTAVDTDWAVNPPQELWRRPVGPGWGSFALAGDRLFTQEQRDSDEVVVCYDADTGEPIWLHADPARFWEALGGAGPRATPTYHAGRLYTLGATGILNALDAETGARIWTRDIAEDSGAPTPSWGFAGSPLVVGDRVIVHAAGAPDGRAVVAYDLATGEPRWLGRAGGPSYSSPQEAILGGVRQVVQLTGEGVFGLDAASGAPLWTYPWPATAGGERIVQPARLDAEGTLLIGTFDEGARKLTVSTMSPGKWSVDEVWTSRGLKPYFNDFVVNRGTAFGFDGTRLAAIDLETGERLWKGGRYGNGQVLLLRDQDLLLVLSERGELALARAVPERFEELARFRALTGKTWNHPILVEGVVFVRNGQEAAAFRLPIATEDRISAAATVDRERETKQHDE
jgi:outer membrane protein assembly factor BamB